MRDTADSVLWYARPAERWTQALPVGNGHLGAMIYGGIPRERICLNHDELWSGGPGALENREAPQGWKEARALAAQGKLREAERLLREKFSGEESQRYLPLGDLEITMRHGGKISSYRRKLDLGRAMSEVSYQVGPMHCRREVFASYPRQILAVRLTFGGQKGSLAIRFSSKLSCTAAVTEQMVTVDGNCPGKEKRDRAGGIPFRCGIRLETDGQVRCEWGGWSISEAGTVTCYLACSTGFAGWDRDPRKSGSAYREECVERLAHLPSYEALKEEHIRDHRELFDRVELNLGAKRGDLPTDRRIRAFQTKKDDPGLVVLLYNFGRYLAIAASRPGSQPMNLQGIWNDRMNPPWNSSYTTNINTQMNYWPMLMCRMPELAEPLNRMILELGESGKKTARDWYDAGGWVAHHNSDLWRMTTPVSGKGLACWSFFWQGSGGWFCRHLYEYYEYTQDEDFLRAVYPTIRGAAQFYLDTLTQTGEYQTFGPAASPENTFCYEGKTCCLAPASTMMTAIVRDVFDICIRCCGILGTDETLAGKLTAAMTTLPEEKIGSRGQLLEWDREYEERQMEPVEREWMGLFGKGGIYDNLFDGHPPFQIDGNFGFVSGVTEMLMQCKRGKIYLLPALPDAWSAGSVRGLLAKGNIVVSFAWKDGSVTTCSLRGEGKCILVIGGTEYEILLQGSGSETTVNCQRPEGEAGEVEKLDRKLKTIPNERE